MSIEQSLKRKEYVLNIYAVLLYEILYNFARTFNQKYFYRIKCVKNIVHKIKI